MTGVGRLGCLRRRLLRLGVWSGSGGGGGGVTLRGEAGLESLGTLRGAAGSLVGRKMSLSLDNVAEAESWSGASGEEAWRTASAPARSAMAALSTSVVLEVGMAT